MSLKKAVDMLVDEKAKKRNDELRKMGIKDPNVSEDSSTEEIEKEMWERLAPLDPESSEYSEIFKRYKDLQQKRETKGAYDSLEIPSVERIPPKLKSIKKYLVEE